MEFYEIFFQTSINTYDICISVYMYIYNTKFFHLLLLISTNDPSFHIREDRMSVIIVVIYII